MKLTPRDIVKRCIEFRDPPRIGLHFKVMPIDGRVWPVTDFALIGYKAAPDFVPAIPGANEWGYRMESFDPTGENMGQVKEHPLGEGWHKLEAFPFPRFDQPEAQYQAFMKYSRYPLIPYSNGAARE